MPRQSVPLVIGRSLLLLGVFAAIVTVLVTDEKPSFANGMRAHGVSLAATTVVDGLDNAVSVATHSGGGVFVADDSGRVTLWGDSQSPARTLDLGVAVSNTEGGGILDLAAAPDGLAVYVLYVADAPPGVDPPHWGDTCETDRIVSGCVLSLQVARLDFDPSEQPAIDVVTDATWCIVHPGRRDGALAVDRSGSLLVASGDGASDTKVDDGFDDVEYASADGSGCSSTNSHRGAFRARQDGEVGQPLNGTVVRLDPTTRPAEPELLAIGIASPAGLAAQLDGDDVWLIDLAWCGDHELDVVDTDSARVEDLGWPCAQTTRVSSGYGQLSECRSRQAETDTSIAPVAVIPATEASAGCGSPARAPVGPVLVDLVGTGEALVWADREAGCVWFAPTGDASRMSTPGLLLDRIAVTDIDADADGNLYLLHQGDEPGSGYVMRVTGR